MNQEPAETRPNAEAQDVRSYALLDALAGRRSRRFAKGMKLNGGPLMYGSLHPPAPLTGKKKPHLRLPPAA